MKFSVLLPTRNRLEYLRYAVESVLRQDYEDWEVIVSDNCSEDDIAGYIADLNEPRLRYFRTPEFVPVTDNWNNALQKSGGDYVIMLGDDDCLTPKYFSEMRQLITEHGSPDFIYTGAWLFAYPGVMPAHPEGYLHRCGYACYLSEKRGAPQSPYWLDRTKAMNLARPLMAFKEQYGYNMQFALVSRRFVDSLQDRGAFFQSSFPDYYSMNVMFLKAERILIHSKPMVVIGITPKSYGFYHFNARENEGVSFLNSSIPAKNETKGGTARLPGSNMNDGWLSAAETVRSNYPEFKLKISHWRYRLLQTIYTYYGYRVHKTASEADYKELMAKLHLREKVSYGIGVVVLKLLKTLLSSKKGVLWIHKMREKLLGRFAPDEIWAPEKTVGQFENMIEVFDSLEAESTANRA